MTEHETAVVNRRQVRFQIDMTIGTSPGGDDFPHIVISADPYIISPHLQREAALALAHYYADDADWSSNPRGPLMGMTVTEITEEGETILRVGHHS